MGNDSGVLYFMDSTSETRTGYWTNKDRFEIRGDSNSKSNVVLNTGYLEIDLNAYIGGRLGVAGTLDVTGKLTVVDSNYETVKIERTGTSNPTIAFHNSTNGLLAYFGALDGGDAYIDPQGANGYFGIGTSAPTAELEVDGNVKIDNGTSSTLTVYCDDTGNATIEARGDGQGTGRIYVGQSTTYGGGIEYNGDNSPSTTGAGADYITLWRRSNGVDNWTARNSHSSNDWEFRAGVTVGTTLDVGGAATVIGLLHADGDLRVDGNIFFQASSTSADYIGYATQQGITYYENGSATWRLSGNGYNFINGGYLGIGTKSPTAKLDVVGNTELNGTLDVSGNVTFLSDLDVSGISTLETAQIGTLRTTLFKPNSINGMGGEFAFTAVSKVVSINAGADTIVIKDPVFSDNDLLIVSSGLYDDTGFVKIKLELTTSGSSVAGGTQYSYIVRSASSNADLSIEAGFTVIRAGNNGVGTSTDLIYVNATEGGDSPSIKAYDGIGSFADSPLDGGSATPVWELTATGGVVGGWNLSKNSICREYATNQFITLSTSTLDASSYLGFSWYTKDASHENNLRLIRIGEITSASNPQFGTGVYGIQVSRGSFGGGNFEDIFRIDSNGEFILRSNDLTILDGNATFSGILSAATIASGDINVFAGGSISGTNWLIDETDWIHPSLGTLVAAGRSEASSTANDDAADINNLYFHEQSTVSFGSQNNKSTKIRSGFVKRSGENTLRIVGRHLIDFNYGSNNGATDIICRVSVFIHDENGSTGVGGAYDNWVEFGRTSNYNSEGNFSFTVDISTLTNDRVYTVEFDMRAQVSHSGSNSSTINFKVQKNVAIRTITD